MTPPLAPNGGELVKRDITSQIYDALRATDIEFCALSTNGINICGDRKSIDAVNAALNSHAQINDICRNLRHWQEECGKLHAKVTSAELTVTALRERLEGMEAALRKAIKIADEAREEWDKAPSGMRAGKILIALSGGCPGYRSDIDDIHAILAKGPGQ